MTDTKPQTQEGQITPRKINTQTNNKQTNNNNKTYPTLGI